MGLFYLLTKILIILFIKKYIMEENETKTEATQVTGCKTCNKGLSTTQKWMMVFAFYMFGAAVYGTIKMIQEIVKLF
jgi:hypothetical protein